MSLPAFGNPDVPAEHPGSANAAVAKTVDLRNSLLLYHI
jgi:hypothetical protein